MLVIGDAPQCTSRCRGACYHRQRVGAQHRAASAQGVLAELLPIVGEISAVLDPDELLPAIARQLRRIVDYQHPRHLPARAGRHPGARASSRATTPRARLAVRIARAKASWARRPRAARAGLRPRRRARTRATSRSSPGSSPSWPSRSSTATAWWACSTSRAPIRDAFTPGGAHGPAGAGRPPGGGHRERDPLSRDALVRGPAGHPVRDRQGDRLHPRPRRAAARAWPRS